MKRATINMSELEELIDEELMKMYRTLTRCGKIDAQTTSFEEWKAQQLEK